MAVQGKLVPQDPNDEPASILLDLLLLDELRSLSTNTLEENGCS